MIHPIIRRRIITTLIDAAAVVVCVWVALWAIGH